MPRHVKAKHPESSHEIMRCVADGAGQLVFVSPSIGWVVGQSAVQLTGKPVHSIISVVTTLEKNSVPQNQYGFYEVALQREGRDPLVIQARMDWVKTQEGKAYTVIWLDPDGTLVKQKQSDLHATATEFVTFIDDNQKRMQKTPEAQAPVIENILTDNTELRHFLNLSSNLMGVYKRDLSFVRVNPAFNRILGFSDAEFKMLLFSELIHPDEKDHILMVLQKLIHEQESNENRASFEARVRCKDGTFRWIEWAMKSVAAGDIYIVGKDVTDTHDHELELLRREQQLSEAQKIGRMGHWYLEVDAEKMEWSDQIYTIFGVDKGTFTPYTDAVSALLLKRDVGRIYKSFQRAILRKRDYELEFSIRRPGGGSRFVRCEGRCKLDPYTNKVKALYGIMQDITERTLHERALREAKESAESAYASKTRFLANMSHELRTPLNAIIGFSEMMQRQLLGPVGNARYLDYINSIRQSGQHLLELINDILDMSKIEVGKYELFVEELNIGKIMRLAVHMVEGRAEESQVRLIADEIPEDIQMMADRRALMQILLNLMSNAVKFTKSGGVVDVKCFRELSGVAIVVSDTGIGIPKEKLDVVTMPFEQVSSEFTRNHEGSGLGLAITKDLIELHGGTLDIESEVGIGTTVTVLLPDRMSESGHSHTRLDDVMDRAKKKLAI